MHWSLSSDAEEERRSKVVDTYKSDLDLPEPDKVCEFLADHYTAFSLSEGDRGETSSTLIQGKHLHENKPHLLAEINKQVQQMLK